MHVQHGVLLAPLTTLRVGGPAARMVELASEDDVVANVILMVFAGHETTMNLLSNGVVAFDRHPGEWRRFQTDPSGLARTAVEALRQRFEKDKTDARLETYCRLLYDEAVIAEGSKVKDPLAFARRINELLVKDAAS